jgi:broad specificity phosphatase PhoE/CTP:molybdopterin cytidylyltransferase MocA
MKQETQTTGIILAAGYSSRMGAFKPLLPLGDSSVIVHQIRTMKQLPLDEILVVIGHQAEQMIPVLKQEGVPFILNKDYEKGMFSSIQAGLRAVEAGNSGCFLALVDSPFVPATVFQDVLAMHKEHPFSLIVPCYRGKKGHPLFIPSSLFPEILSHSGEGGLKFITDRHNDDMIRLEVDSESVVMDMDTRQDYEELLQYYRKKELPIGQNPAERNVNQSRTLYLIRHGETQQQSDKVFIGQWDVPLNALGREQAKKVALALLEEQPDSETIYCSDLLRATETATLIANAMKRSYSFDLVATPAFRELSLGDWDGLLIEDVKQRYPEEYRKRGETLLTYKIGNDSENFYDLRYRVMKKLHQLMEETTGDLILVTHAGVIRVILSELLGEDLEGMMGIKIPKGSLRKVPII